MSGRRKLTNTWDAWFKSDWLSDIKFVSVRTQISCQKPIVF